MTTAEAAKFIGCSIHQVQWLCRNGKLKAKRVMVKVGASGTKREVWSIDRKSAEKYKNAPKTETGSLAEVGGFPRGQKRSKKRD